MAAPYRIQPSHKQNSSPVYPSSDRAEVLVEQKKAPIRIVSPKGSLKNIEKDTVKRKTQLFEQGDISVSHQAGFETPQTQKEPSPTYKPSPEAFASITKSSDSDNHGQKSSNVAPAYPYKPKSDARISKAIGLEARAKVEQLNIKKSTPPERPKLPPSPVSRDKPRYPYKPIVENEIDAHGKGTNKFSKHSPNFPQNAKLTVNTSLSCSDIKDATSPKSPSPPIRPPPPKFQQTDKKISTLIAHKSKVFEAENLDTGTESKKPTTVASDSCEVKVKERRGSSRSHFESVQFERGLPRLVSDVQEERSSESTAQNVANTEKSEVPQYGQVNKAKKVIEKDLKFQPEQSDTNSSGEVVVVPHRPNRPKHVTSTPPGVDSDTGNNSVQTLMKALSERIQGPPVKPPRTFAHDEYMKVKAEKHQKKKQHLGTQSPLATVHNYEEIEDISSGGIPPPPPFKPSHIQPNTFQPPSEVYEEVAAPPSVTTAHGRVSKISGTDYQDIAVKKTYTYDKLDEKAVSANPNKASKPSVPTKPGGKEQTTLKTKTADKNDKARWDKGFVRIKSPNPRLRKEPIVSKKAIANPGYEPWDHECIPIKTVYKGGTMKRYKSDECLYAENTYNPRLMSNEEPLYQDPVDVIKEHKGGEGYMNTHGVAFDGAGYAVPSIGQTSGKMNVPQKRYQKRGEMLKRTGTLAYATHRHNNSRARTGSNSSASVKEKVSEAYAVLRRRTVRQENGAEGDGTGCYGLEDGEDSDSDLDSDEHQKHVDYVCTTKLRIKNPHYKSVYEKAMLKGPQAAPDQVQQLFDYGLIVGLEEIGESKQYTPKVLHCFPHQESVDIGIISSFCFPDASVWRPVSHYRTENFSFVLTASDATRQYGYCRRFLPPDVNNANRLPEVLCLVTSICAWNFYADLLKELQDRRKVSDQLAQHLLELAYGKPMPSPGQEVWIRCPGDKEAPETVFVKRSADEKLDKVSPSLLLERLSVDNLLQVFSSLLLERKLIFIAQHLGTLTDCIHALLSLLYPFTWQHTFIPILPGELLEVCDAPTPYVVGALAGHYPQIHEMEVDDVMIVDLNNDSIIKCVGDETSILPKKLQKALKMALKPDNSPQSEKDMMVTEAFLRMFLETVGHYTDYINTQQNGAQEFHRDSFVRAVSSKSIRMFLEWFSETQMFEMFVTTKMESLTIADGLFEQRLEDYRDEMEKLPPSVRKNIKDAGKKVINFFKESGGKIKKVFV